MPSQAALTIAEFCNKYRIDRSTYYRNAKSGRMPPAIKIGHATRILVEDEQSWIESQRSKTPIINADYDQGERV